MYLKISQNLQEKILRWSLFLTLIWVNVLGVRFEVVELKLSPA